jgi:hypothetical protein
MPTAGSSRVFGNETSCTNVLVLPVQLTIVAEIDLSTSKLAVETLDGSILSAGGEVALGNTLKVSIEAADYDGLAISRPGLQIVVRLCTGENETVETVNLVFVNGSRYRAEVPGAWIQDAGDYFLAFTSSNDGTTLKFPLNVRASSLSLYIALSISSVRGPSAAHLLGHYIRAAIAYTVVPLVVAATRAHATCHGLLAVQKQAPSEDVLAPISEL